MWLIERRRAVGHRAGSLLAAGQEAAERVATVWSAMVPDSDQIEVTWHDQAALVDCGRNLTKISCPLCGAEIDPEWWADLVSERYEDGFDDLNIVAPCCGGRVSLNELVYDWPVGFARFELEARNPQRGWLTDDALEQLSAVLGYPVRQVMAHI